MKINTRFNIYKFVPHSVGNFRNGAFNYSTKVVVCLTDNWKTRVPLCHCSDHFFPLHYLSLNCKVFVWNKLLTFNNKFKKLVICIQCSISCISFWQYCMLPLNKQTKEEEESAQQFRQCLLQTRHSWEHQKLVILNTCRSSYRYLSTDHTRPLITNELLSLCLIKIDLFPLKKKNHCSPVT